MAWEVLRAVDERGAYANLLLPSMLAGSGLSTRDRGFVTELAYGALRAQGTLDGMLDTATSRPVAGIDPPLRDALRLGAYQLLRTRVPARAAVATTVDLVRATSGERPVRFANAVLRRVAARVSETGGDLAQLLDAPPFATDPIGHLTAVCTHPRWIVEAVAEALDGDLDETRAALVANDIRPSTHLVARPGRITRDDLLAECVEAGLDAHPGPWSPYAVRLDGGDPGRLPSVASGAAAVQDEGSQLVALALAATPTVGPDRGLTVDLCAGPGGKAALLAGLLAGGSDGAGLLALEPRMTRAGLVARSLEGMAGAWVARADGRAAPLAPASADRVLVDVPCSGLGALRRRPEARWRRTPEDVAALVPLQRALLVAAADLVRPGGVVAYATCSPHPAETSEVVRQVAGQRPELSLLDATRVLTDVSGSDVSGGDVSGGDAPGSGVTGAGNGTDSGAETGVGVGTGLGLGDGPFGQLWPHRHGTDAMFVALLRVGPR
ncbi:RsmB/NOP family class I SAM-dependent RNA methyltransferase [Candidatus Frankia nodulisporulans]|uniref:RsmB/NOP family class I SAM-dependent RNA methyltransferase n=1 Tax=Candidatus Frankia nodulisporulans TaxID=2060052 RepID=UPI0015817E3B|nr:transcription antitermination factor NusB [Candidatus Frankia nodulisporulans]